MLAASTFYAAPRQIAAKPEQGLAGAASTTNSGVPSNQSFGDVMGDVAAGSDTKSAASTSDPEGSAPGAPANLPQSTSINATQPFPGSGAATTLPAANGQAASSIVPTKSAAGEKSAVTVRRSPDTSDPLLLASGVSCVTTALPPAEMPKVAAAGAELPAGTTGSVSAGVLRAGPTDAIHNGSDPGSGETSCAIGPGLPLPADGSAMALPGGDAPATGIATDAVGGSHAASLAPNTAAHQVPGPIAPSAEASAPVHAAAAAGAGDPLAGDTGPDGAAATAADHLPASIAADMVSAHAADSGLIAAQGSTANAAAPGPAQTNLTASSAAAPDFAASPPPAAFPVAIATTDDAGTSIVVRSGELGTVEVRLGTSDDGTALVTVAADRADTLNVMAADRDQMQFMLAQAGVEPAGRRIEYTLLPPDQAPGTANTGGGGGSGDAGRDGGNARDAAEGWASPTNRRNLSQDATQPRSVSRTLTIRRTTVDITA